MQKLWIALCEIGVEPGDLPSGATAAFSNVVTWADDENEVQSKIRSYLESFKWALLFCDEVHPVEEKDYGDELNSLIDRASPNPQAILLGTFHSYKPN